MFIDKITSSSSTHRQTITKLLGVFADVIGLMLAFFGFVAALAPGGITPGLDLIGLGGLLATGGNALIRYASPTRSVDDIAASWVLFGSFVFRAVFGVVFALFGALFQAYLLVLFGCALFFLGGRRLASKAERKEEAADG